MNPTATIYFRTAAVLLVISMAAGLYMSVSGDHRAGGAHAHFSLIGFVLTAAYGAFFALAGAEGSPRGLAMTILGLNAGGAVVMFGALWMVVTGTAAMQPVLAHGSLAVFAGAVLFAVAVFRPVLSGRPLTPAKA